MNNLLTRERLLGATDRRFETITTHVGEARIRNLTEEEKSNFEGNIWGSKGDVSVANMRTQRRRLVALCLVDDNGNPLLKPGDDQLLKKIDGAITTQIFRECRLHCGFEEGEIEELVKNSEETTDDDSVTTSSASSD